MITTTVRLDGDLYAKVKFHAERLGIAGAAVIRDATFLYVAGMEIRDSHLRKYVGDAIADHDRRIDHLEQWIQQGGDRACVTR